MKKDTKVIDITNGKCKGGCSSNIGLYVVPAGTTAEEAKRLFEEGLKEYKQDKKAA